MRLGEDKFRIIGIDFSSCLFSPTFFFIGEKENLKEYCK